METFSNLHNTPARWWVYVIVSSTRNLTYVGSTTDPIRRVRQHNGEIRGGAKSTRGKGPWLLGKVYGPYPSRSSAFKAEIALKRGKRSRGRLLWSSLDSAHCVESVESSSILKTYLDSLTTETPHEEVKDGHELVPCETRDGS